MLNFKYIRFVLGIGANNYYLLLILIKSKLTNQMSLSLCVINLSIIKQGGRQVYYHN